MSVNHSLLAQITKETKLVSDSQIQIFTILVYVILCGTVSLLGIMANVINLVVFYKQGLNTTINISFFAMAVSDLSGLLLQQWYITCVNPLVINSGIAIVFPGVRYITGAVPREEFALITCLITAYITAERCFCIIFPLHIKQMITPRKTSVVIISLYVGTWITGIPLYCTSYID